MGSLTLSFAHFYHQETKYSPENLKQQSASLDWESQPYPFKEYKSNHKQIDLSPYLPLSTNPFSNIALKKSNCWTDEEKPLAELSRLLYFANGITAIVPYPPNPLLMRAAPSAGGLYPNELYIVSSDYHPELGNGLFNYQVKTHSLCQLIDGKSPYNSIQKACFNHPAVEETDLIIIISGIFERSAWRYGDRAYRRVLLDAGHIWGNIELIAYLFGRKAYCLGGFNDHYLNDSLMFENEYSLMVIALPKINKSQSQNINLLDNPIALASSIQQQTAYIPKGKRINALHHFSEINQNVTESKVKLIDKILKEYSDEPQDANFQCFLESEKLDFTPIEWEKCSLMTTILKRRSARKFDSDMQITKKQLGQILQFAYNPNIYKGISFDEKPLTFVPELLKTHLIINNVEGLDSGCYLYEWEGQSIKQIRFKELKDEAHYLCLGQEMGRDASVLIFHTCDLAKAVKIYGERVYRYLHLDAGFIGQKINLAAIKLGLGASGIGGFFDDIANESLGIAESNIILYITAVGVPIEQAEEIF